MRPGKIPVFRTVGAGIAFLFVRFPSILRASIVPGLFAGASLFALHWYVLPSLTQEGAFGAGTFRNPYLGLPFVAIYLFASIMFLVGVAKVYFRQPIGALYAGAGPSEWRLLGGTVGMVLILFVVCGIPALLVIWQMTLTSWDLGAATLPQTRHVTPVIPFWVQQDIALMFVLILMGLAVLGFYIFLSFRFSLLVPASVKEGRFGVWRSWQLMRGNVWRMVGVIFLVLLAVGVLVIPVGMATVWLLSVATADDPKPFVVDAPVTLDSFLTVPGLITLGANSFLYMLTTAIFIGAWGFAFQKLSDDMVSENDAISP